MRCNHSSIQFKPMKLSDSNDKPHELHRAESMPVTLCCRCLSGHAKASEARRAGTLGSSTLDNLRRRLSTLFPTKHFRIWTLLLLHKQDAATSKQEQCGSACWSRSSRNKCHLSDVNHGWFAVNMAAKAMWASCHGF